MVELHASEDKLRLTPRVSERVWANPNYLRGTPERTPLVSNLVSLDTSEPHFVSQVVQFQTPNDWRTGRDSKAVLPLGTRKIKTGFPSVRKLTYL